MNDFTKDELLSIIGAFNYVEDDPAWRCPIGWDNEVKAKLQSMIDNYCEHEWQDITEYFGGSKRICNKCSTVNEAMIDGILETRLIKYE